MLKSLYRNLIMTAFGQFVENFDEKIIEVNQWGGKFIAENLIIKKNALDFLSEKIGIPLEIKYGLIKKIELEIEWDKFLLSNSSLKFSEVHLMCMPGHNYDSSFKNKIVSKLKNDLIEKKFKHICENFFNEKLTEIKNFSPNLNWKQKFLKTFTGNINIRIDNFHLRFEENYLNKAFDFGIAISLIEYKNTDKNGMELFLDHETKVKLGKCFSVVEIHKFAVYFNNSEKKFSQDEINFNLIFPDFKLDNSHINIRNNPNKSFNKDNNKNNLFFSQIKNNSMISNNYSKSSNKSYSSAKSFLPIEYEQYFDFSSKIFNTFSYEYTNQNFIIEPVDLYLKIRKNTNPQMNNDLPLSSILIDNNSEFNIVFNEGILNDLIYLKNLRSYQINEFTNFDPKHLFEMKNINLEELQKIHGGNLIEILKNNLKEYECISELFDLLEPKIKLEEGLGIKKAFLKENYTKQQKIFLFKAAIQKIIELKNKGKFIKDILYKKLYLIQKYKKIYNLILLNQHEYTQIKLKREELLSFSLYGNKIIFQDLNEAHANIIDIQMELDEKLILWLRLDTLLKFKNFLENLINTDKQNENKSFFNYFSIDLSKLNIFKKSSNNEIKENIIEKNSNIFTEAELSENNYDSISRIINSDIDESEKINKEINKMKFLEKKTISFNSFKFENINLIFQGNSVENSIDCYNTGFSLEKKKDLIKVNLQKVLFQAYESTRSKKRVLIVDDFSISDLTLPNSKFNFILTKTKMIRYINTFQSFEIKSFYDDIGYDQDGFVQKITQNELNLVRNHFFKFLNKAYVNNNIKRNLVCDVKDFDLFLNLPFYKNLIRVFNEIQSEDKYLNIKLLELEKLFNCKEEILLEKIKKVLENCKKFYDEHNIKKCQKQSGFKEKVEIPIDKEISVINQVIISNDNIKTNKEKNNDNKNDFKNDILIEGKIDYENDCFLNKSDAIIINNKNNAEYNVSNKNGNEYSLLQNFLKGINLNKFKKKITDFSISEIKFSKIRIFLLNNYYDEDYKAFVLELNNFNSCTNRIKNNVSIENISLYHTDNFLISISINSNERTKIHKFFDNFKVKFKSDLLENQKERILINFPNDLILTINKNILYLLFEFKKNILSLLLDYDFQKNNSSIKQIREHIREDEYNLKESSFKIKKDKIAFLKYLNLKLKNLLNLCKNRETDTQILILKENFIKKYLIELEKMKKNFNTNKNHNQNQENLLEQLNDFYFNDEYEVASDDDNNKNFFVDDTSILDKNLKLINKNKDTIINESDNPFNILTRNSVNFPTYISNSEIILHCNKVVILFEEYSESTIENKMNENNNDSPNNNSYYYTQESIIKKMYYLVLEKINLKKNKNLILEEDIIDFDLSNLIMGILNPMNFYEKDYKDMVKNNEKLIKMIESSSEIHKESIIMNFKLTEKFTLDLLEYENINYLKEKNLNLKRKRDIYFDIKIDDFNIKLKNLLFFSQDLNKYIDDLNFLIDKNIPDLLSRLPVSEEESKLKENTEKKTILNEVRGLHENLVYEKEVISNERNSLNPQYLINKIENLFHKIQKVLLKNQKDILKNLNMTNKKYKSNITNNLNTTDEINENQFSNEDFSIINNDIYLLNLSMSENNFKKNNNLTKINKTKFYQNSKNSEIDITFEIQSNIKNLKINYFDVNEEHKFIFNYQNINIPSASNNMGYKRYESLLNNNRYNNKKTEEHYKKDDNKYFTLNISNTLKFDRNFHKQYNPFITNFNIEKKEDIVLFINEFEVKSTNKNFIFKLLSKNIDESANEGKNNKTKDQNGNLNSKPLFEFYSDIQKNLKIIDLQNLFFYFDNSSLQTIKELQNYYKLFKENINVLKNSINEIKMKIERISIKIFLRNVLENKKTISFSKNNFSIDNNITIKNNSFDVLKINNFNILICLFEFSEINCIIQNILVENGIKKQITLENSKFTSNVKKISEKTNNKANNEVISRQFEKNTTMNKTLYENNYYKNNSKLDCNCEINQYLNDYSNVNNLYILGQKNNTKNSLNLCIDMFILDLTNNRAKSPKSEKTKFVKINSIKFTKFVENVIKIEKGVQFEFHYFHVLVLRDIHKFYMNVQKSFDFEKINKNLNKTVSQEKNLQEFNNNLLAESIIKEKENCSPNGIINQEKKYESEILDTILNINYVEFCINDFFLKEKFNEITINPSNNIRILIEDIFLSKIISNNISFHKNDNLNTTNENNTFKFDFSVFFSIYIFLAEEKIFQFSKNKKSNNINLFSSNLSLPNAEKNFPINKREIVLHDENCNDLENLNISKDNVYERKDNFYFENHYMESEENYKPDMNNYLENVNFIFKKSELIIDIPLIKLILSEKIFGVLKLIKNYLRVSKHYFKELKINSRINTQNNVNFNSKPIELVLEFLNLNFFRINISSIIFKFKETIHTQINSDFNFGNSIFEIQNFNKETKNNKKIFENKNYFYIKENPDEEENIINQNLSEKHKIKNRQKKSFEKVNNINGPKATDQEYEEIKNLKLIDNNPIFKNNNNPINHLNDYDIKNEEITENINNMKKEEIENYNENLHLTEFDQNLYIKFSFEFFFNNYKKTGDTKSDKMKLIKLNDFSVNLNACQVYFFNKIKTKFSNFLDEKNFIVFPFDININSKDEINVNLNNIEFDFSIRKISLLRRIKNQMEDNYLKTKNEYLLKNKNYNKEKSNSNNKLFSNKKPKFKLFYEFENKKDKIDKSNINSLKNNKSFLVSKRDIIKKSLFENKIINMKLNNLSLIISKEDSINSKIFEPLFNLTLKKTKIKLQNEEISIQSNILIEYFNNLNLFWEPLIEKTCFNLKFINSSLNLCETFINFEKGININFTLQIIKNLQVIIDDRNNIDKYSNSEEIAQNFVNLNFNYDTNEGNNLNNFLNTINNNRTNSDANFINSPKGFALNYNHTSRINVPNFNNIKSKYNSAHINYNKSCSNLNNISAFENLEKPIKKTFYLNSSFSKIENDFYSKKQFRLNNNYIENLLLKKSYYFQIENLIGDDLLLIIDEKSVIKISNKQIIPIEKVFIKNENLKNSFIRNNDSMISLRSFNSIGSENTAHNCKYKNFKKFNQKNEKLFKIDKIQNINFQIQQIRKTFSVNLHKNFQEIEIAEKNHKMNKIIVSTFIDYNGRKVFSFKSAYKIINKLRNIAVEINLFIKSDNIKTNNINQSETSSHSIIIQPLGEIYVPFRIMDFFSLKIRPYLNDMNYYQPYSFSETIEKESKFLKDGIILRIQDARLDKKIVFDDVYLCVYTEIVDNEFYDENQLFIDYNMEIQNYMPHKFLMFFDEEKVVSKTNMNNSNTELYYDLNYLKDNLIYLDSFSLLKLNSLNIEFISNSYLNNIKFHKNATKKIMNIVNLSEKKFVDTILENLNSSNNDNMNINNQLSNENPNENLENNNVKKLLLKKENILNINLENLMNKNYQLIQIKSPLNDCKNDRFMMKVDLQLMKNKIIMRFYVDVIMINQLDENINININRNINKIKKYFVNDENIKTFLKETENINLNSLKEYYKILNKLCSSYMDNCSHSYNRLIGNQIQIENFRKEKNFHNLENDIILSNCNIEDRDNLKFRMVNNEHIDNLNDFEKKSEKDEDKNKRMKQQNNDYALRNHHQNLISKPDQSNNKSSPYLSNFNVNNYNLNSNNGDFKRNVLSKIAKSKFPRKTSIDTDVISITNKTYSTMENNFEYENPGLYLNFELNQKNSENRFAIMDYIKLNRGFLRYLELDNVLSGENISNKFDIFFHDSRKFDYNNNCNYNKINNEPEYFENLHSDKINQKKNMSINYNFMNLNIPNLNEIYINNNLKNNNYFKIISYIKNNKLNKKIHNEKILDENCFILKRSNWIIASEFFCLFEDDRFFIEMENSQKEELPIFNRSDQIYQDYNLTIQSEKFLNELIFSIKFLQEYSNDNISSGFYEKENINYNKYNFANRSANLLYDNVFVDKKRPIKINDTLGSNLQEKNLINFSKNISTKIILIREKFYFFNKTNHNIILTQDKCFEINHYIIYPGGYTTFKWINKDFPQKLKIKLDDSYFSNTFKIDSIGEFYINVKRNTNTIIKNSIIKVFITEKQGRIITTFEDLTEEPPIIFVNKTNKIFKLEEIKKSNLFLFNSSGNNNDIIIYPFSTIPFSMEDLIMNNLTVKVNCIGYEYQSFEDKFIELSNFNIIEIEEKKKNFENFIILNDKSKNLYLEMESENSENYFLLKIYKNENMNHVLEISEINILEKTQIQNFILKKQKKIKGKNNKQNNFLKKSINSNNFSEKSSINAINSIFSPFNFNSNILNAQNNNIPLEISKKKLNSTEFLNDNSNSNFILNTISDINLNNNYIQNEDNRGSENLILNKISNNKDYGKINNDLENLDKFSNIKKNLNDQEKINLNNSKNGNSSKFNEIQIEEEETEYFNLNEDYDFENNINNLIEENNREKIENYHINKNCDFEHHNKNGNNISSEKKIRNDNLKYKNYSEFYTVSSYSSKEENNNIDNIIKYISEYNLNSKIKKKKIYLNISFIGVSILDPNPNELAYVYLKGFNMIFSNSSKNIFKVNISLSNLQIDNSIENTMYPVILKTNNYTNNKNGEIENILTFKTEYNYNKSGNVIYIDNLEIILKHKLLFFADGLTFIKLAGFAKSLGKIIENNTSKIENFANTKFNRKQDIIDIVKNKYDKDNNFIKDDDNLRNIEIQEQFNENYEENGSFQFNLNFLDDLELEMLKNVRINSNNLNHVSSNFKSEIDEKFIKAFHINEGRMKILLNKIFISQVSFELNIKPSQNLINKFSNPLKSGNFHL